tara:strand:+ start:1028 stop:1657 length:630 start_codon:yes stop_codon:yes gene_type:complete
MKISNEQLQEIILEEFDTFVSEGSIDEGVLDRIKRAIGAGRAALQTTPEDIEAAELQALTNAVDVAKGAVQSFADNLSKKRSAMVKKLGKLDLEDLLERNPELVKSVRGALSSSKGLQTRLDNLLLNLDLVLGGAQPETEKDLATLDAPAAPPEARRRPRGAGVASGTRRGAQAGRELGRAGRGGITVAEGETFTKEALVQMIKDELEN